MTAQEIWKQNGLDSFRKWMRFPNEVDRKCACGGTFDYRHVVLDSDDGMGRTEFRLECLRCESSAFGEEQAELRRITSARTSK